MFIMAFEDNNSGEKITKKKTKPPLDMTLAKAIEMGEYDPDYLSTFPQWHTISRHIQFQYIRTALDNRHRQLILHWAEINNMLDFRLKPHLKDALENIEKQLKILEKDRENLYTKYSL